MNRAETYKLMLHINGVFGLRRPPDSDEVDRWHAMLVDVDEFVARRAVRDMAETDPGHAPTLAKMLAALHRPTERRPGPVHPTGDPNCSMCDGTGWVLTADPADPSWTTRSYGPCPICRPEHPWLKHRHRAQRAPTAPGSVATAEGRSLINSIRASIHRHPSGSDGAA
jgi:hypothetical protein